MTMLKSNLTNKAYQRIIFFFLFEIFPIYQVFYLLAFLIRPIRSTTRIVRCRATLVTWHKKPCKVFLAWQKGKEPHERKSSIYELHFNLVRTNRSLHRERCFSSCHERGANNKKYSEFPRGIEPQTYGFRAQMLWNPSEWNPRV